MKGRYALSAVSIVVAGMLLTSGLECPDLANPRPATRGVDVSAFLGRNWSPPNWSKGKGGHKRVARDLRDDALSLAPYTVPRSWARRMRQAARREGAAS